MDPVVKPQDDERIATQSEETGFKMIIVNGRNKLEWTEGFTVQDVLDKMRYDYALITVTVNNEIVSEDDYDSFKVADDSDVRAIHLCHGG